jgi:muramidase (phage lysozyme)
VNSRELAIAGAALAAFLLWPKQSRASEVIIDRNAPDDPNALEFDLPLTEGYSAPTFAFPDVFSSIDWLEGDVFMKNDPLSAFLYMIRSSEHLLGDVKTGNDYRTFFGGARFFDFSDHPVITGELKGVPLKPEWCRAAGYPSGRCVSTAAGAYQFTRPTWDDGKGGGLRAAGRWGPRLPDFSPANQDEAARRLLSRLGVPARLATGDLQGAIAAASARWASLPGSTSGQPQKSMAFALAKFNEGLSTGTWQA